MNNNKIKFYETDEVAHLENIEQKMRVEEVVFEKNRLKYLTCWWFTEEKKVARINAHSNSLVPWSIASQGQSFVDSYLKSLEVNKSFEHYENEHN